MCFIINWSTGLVFSYIANKHGLLWSASEGPAWAHVCPSRPDTRFITRSYRFCWIFVHWICSSDVDSGPYKTWYYCIKTRSFRIRLNKSWKPSLSLHSILHPCNRLIHNSTIPFSSSFHISLCWNHTIPMRFWMYESYDSIVNITRTLIYTTTNVYN